MICRYEYLFRNTCDYQPYVLTTGNKTCVANYSVFVVIQLVFLLIRSVSVRLSIGNYVSMTVIFILQLCMLL